MDRARDGEAEGGDRLDGQGAIEWVDVFPALGIGPDRCFCRELYGVCDEWA